MLRLIAQAIGTANKAKVPIAVCGEMAGEVQLTRLLLGMGLREFSMHPAHLLDVKQRVLHTDVAAIKPIVDRMRRADDAERVRRPARAAERLTRNAARRPAVEAFGAVRRVRALDWRDARGRIER